MFFSLKNEPIKTMAKWQDERFLWLFMAFTSIILIIIAHAFFQHYLFMLPCEQCVYIRFAFFCIFFAGLISAINPKNIFLKLIGYVLGFYGIVKGLQFSYILAKIHKDVRDPEKIFGFHSCSNEPTFPFNLPLDKWFSDMFLPTGDCGYDYPIVPNGENLSFLQSLLLEYYHEGWYLFPSTQTINMAQCCFVIFAILFLLLSFMLISFILSKKQNKA